MEPDEHAIIHDLKALQDPAVATDGSAQGCVGFAVQEEAVVVQVLEVEVFVSGMRFFQFVSGCFAFVSATFEIELAVHLYGGWKEVVHDHEPNVLTSALIAVETVELRQESSWVLVQIHEIPRQQFLQKLGLLLLHSLNDELIIVRDVEDATRRSGVRRLFQGLVAEGEHEVLRRNVENVSEISESQWGVSFEFEVTETVCRSEV